MVYLQPSPPFSIHKESDGTHHAISKNVQLSVLPNVDREVKINHRVAGQMVTGKQHTRWLQAKVGDLFIYVNGSHVVVSGKRLFPTSPPKTTEEWIEEGMKYMRATKDSKGRYVCNSEENKKVLKTLLEGAVEDAIADFSSRVRYSVIKAADSD